MTGERETVIVRAEAMSDPNFSLAQTLVVLLQAGQAQREHVSRILHDEVGQVLSAVGLQLELLRMDYEHLAPDIASRTESIQNMVESALEPLRRLVSELDPAARSRARAIS